MHYRALHHWHFWLELPSSWRQLLYNVERLSSIVRKLSKARRLVNRMYNRALRHWHFWLALPSSWGQLLYNVERLSSIVRKLNKARRVVNGMHYRALHHWYARWSCRAVEDNCSTMTPSSNTETLLNGVLLALDLLRCIVVDTQTAHQCE